MVVVSAAGQGTDVKVKVKTITKPMYMYMYLRVLTKKDECEKTFVKNLRKRYTFCVHIYKI